MDSSSIRWMLISPDVATVNATQESGNIWWMLFLQLILIALNAIFACAEIAVISTSDAKLEKLVEEGNKKAKRLLKLKSDSSRFLATIQVAITLSGFLGSAFAADNFSGRIVNWLVSLGVTIPEATLNTIAVIVITLILSFFTLVLGELVPKRIAMRKAEALGLKMAGPISVIAKLFAPLVFLLTAATNGILRLFGINPNEADNDVSEEDIQILVEAGSKTGAIDVEEKNMIHNIFEFDDLTAMDVATHRTEVSLLWLEETEDEWDEKIRTSNHGVYPICDETVDKIVGTLNARDYYKLGTKDRKTVMDNIVKTPYFVPENVKADVLFKNMKQTRNLFAVVLDEYGGMSGIVTMNDLIGALIGTAVGAAIWAGVWLMGYMASIVGLAIGVLAERGYTLLKGKKGTLKVIILIICVLLGVIAGTLAGEYLVMIDALKDMGITGVPFKDLAEIYIDTLKSDSELMGEFVKNIMIGFLFAALGVFAFIRKKAKETAPTKVKDLKD